jgi:hypothetical protein
MRGLDLYFNTWAGRIALAEFYADTRRWPNPRSSDKAAFLAALRVMKKCQRTNNVYISCRAWEEVSGRSWMTIWDIIAEDNTRLERIPLIKSSKSYLEHANRYSLDMNSIKRALDYVNCEALKLYINDERLDCSILDTLDMFLILYKYLMCGKYPPVLFDSPSTKLWLKELEKNAAHEAFMWGASYTNKPLGVIAYEIIKALILFGDLSLTQLELITRRSRQAVYRVASTLETVSIVTTGLQGRQRVASLNHAWPQILAGIRNGLLSTYNKSLKRELATTASRAKYRHELICRIDTEIQGLIDGTLQLDGVFSLSYKEKAGIDIDTAIQQLKYRKVQYGREKNRLMEFHNRWKLELRGT